MTPAKAIFLCLVHAIGIPGNPSMPVVVKDSRALFLRGHLADTNAATLVVTFSDGWDCDTAECDEYYRKLTAHEWARNLLLRYHPEISQQSATKEFNTAAIPQSKEVYEYEQKCKDAE